MEVKRFGSVALLKDDRTARFYTEQFAWMEFGYFYGVEEALRAMGVRYHVIRATNVQRDVLRDHPLLVLVEASLMADRIMEELIQYTEAGGMVMTVGRVGNRSEDGAERKELSHVERILGVERRATRAEGFWGWWDTRFLLEPVGRGRWVYPHLTEPIPVYMDATPPTFNDDVEVLAELRKVGEVFPGIVARKVGEGRVLTILPPVGQNIYDYLKDHRYAFFGSKLETDMPRRDWYPGGMPEDPEAHIDLTCAKLYHLLHDSIRWLLSHHGPVVSKYQWPDALETVCFTSHDYDGMGKEQVEVSGYLQALHKRHDIRSTHYFITDSYALDSPEIQNIFRDLKEHGDEIAIHGTIEGGSYSPEHVREEATRLSVTAGVVIEGQALHGEHAVQDSYRARPGVDVTLAVAKAGLLHARNSISYTSPYHQAHGSTTCFPFWYPDLKPNGQVETTEVLEIPFVISDAHPVRMRFSKALMRRVNAAVFDAVVTHEGLFALVAHPHHERYPDKAYRDVYEDLIVYTKRREVRWWRASDIAQWKRDWDTIQVEGVNWDGQRVQFEVRGPEGIYRSGRPTLRIDGWGDCGARAEVDGVECRVVRKGVRLLVVLPIYGTVRVEKE